jgi:hypothetical protein
VGDSAMQIPDVLTDRQLIISNKSAGDLVAVYPSSSSSGSSTEAG